MWQAADHGKIGADRQATICDRRNHRRPEAGFHFEDTDRGLLRINVIPVQLDSLVFEERTRVVAVDALWHTTLMRPSVCLQRRPDL